MKATAATEARPFKILSLDGGGIRGAFIAGFLEHVEELKRCRIADHFDLIAGTSTGAIIAAALALHEPASRIVQFYRDRGPKIFTRQPRLAKRTLKQRMFSWCADRLLKKFDLDSDLLWQSKYAQMDLESALVEVFGERQIEDAKTRLVIPAVDLTRGQTIVFKTPHFPGLFRDRHYAIAKVLRATTAAPTYFPPAVIQPGSAYADGGLWANNPCVVAIAEAFKIQELANREGVDLPIDLNSIFMLSIGTGRAAYFAQSPAEKSGYAWWAPKLYNISSISQSQGVSFQAQYILGNRFFRIDYDLPDGRWNLDNVDVLDEMIRIGHEQSVTKLSELNPVFFTASAQHAYIPFPNEPQGGTGQVAVPTSAGSPV